MPSRACASNRPLPPPRSLDERPAFLYRRRFRTGGGPVATSTRPSRPKPSRRSSRPMRAPPPPRSKPRSRPSPAGAPRRHRRAATSCVKPPTCSTQRADDVGRDLTREEGKTLAEGIGETRRAVADPALLRRADARAGRRNVSQSLGGDLPLRAARARSASSRPSRPGIFRLLFRRGRSRRRWHTATASSGSLPSSCR